MRETQSLNPLLYRETVSAALAEDLGRGGDLTTDSTVPATLEARGRIIARKPGVAAGIDLAIEAFSLLDPKLEIHERLEDGDLFQAGSILLEFRAQARAILTAERVALNFLGALCGIATLTQSFVEAVETTGADILDTRKTTPGLRALEKYAVRCGGGRNHRMGLDDAVLIKDNHIVAAGGIVAAIKAARRHAPHTVKIEIEVDTLEQLEEALILGPEIILLDNMEPKTLRRAVEMIDGRAISEASGGISPETAAEIAATGVDYLSVGALTHSAPALDLSLELEIP